MKKRKLTALFLAIVFCFSFFSSCNFLLGGGPAKEPGSQTEEQSILFSGLDDLTVLAGTYVDLYDGVTAQNADGEDISASIELIGGFNWGKAGEYKVKYRATYAGETVEKERKVSVTTNPELNDTEAPYIYTTENERVINRGASAYGSGGDLMPAANAVDGDISSRWESAHGEGIKTLTVDLGAELEFSRIEILWEAAYAVEYNIQISFDNKVYTDIIKVSDNTSTQNSFLSGDFLAAAKARYVRLECAQRKTAYGYSIYEFEIFGKESVAIPDGMYEDAGVFEFEDDEQFLIADLGEIKNVGKVWVSWTDWLTAKSCALYYSSDNENFTFVKRNDNSYTEFASLNISARYFKAVFYQRSIKAPCYIVNEFKVYDLSGAEIRIQSLTASASAEGFPASKANDGDWNSAWKSPYTQSEYQTFDLGTIKEVGAAELTFENNFGKVWEMEISDDAIAFKNVARITHGGFEKQTLYLYKSFRYARVREYSNTSDISFKLRKIIFKAQVPTQSASDYITGAGQIPRAQTVALGAGSYLTNEPAFPTARNIMYLAENLRNRPVPSNDWWQSLLINNLGHKMYLNPLTAKFTTEGLAVANPGEGYFYGPDYDDRSQKIAEENDIYIMSDDLNVNKMYSTVVGYSDYGVAVTLSDNKYPKMTFDLVQGAAYVYVTVADNQKAYVTSENFTGFYDNDGGEILSYDNATYKSDHILIKLNSVYAYKNIGGTRTALKEDRYYVLNAPKDTVFCREGKKIYMLCEGSGNYFSLGACDKKDNAGLFYEHGYAFINSTAVSYDVDDITNDVTTTFKYRVNLKEEGRSKDPIVVMMPHQYKKSADKLNGCVYKSIRGDCKAVTGSVFKTVDKFYGMVPQFTEPGDDGYSRSLLLNYMAQIDSNTSGDLISGDPYWQGKNLQPLALAILACDQIGAEEYKQLFLGRLKIILTEWFTYNGSPDDMSKDAYFYYDKEWGTLYYHNSEFGANTGITDHHFTYGYYTLAAGVLCMFDEEFKNEFGDMTDLLIRDYANPDYNDALFPAFRNYDPFAGHSWAGGYSDNDGGNNQEAGGESLHGWVGMYIYSLVTGNEKYKNAAIYGFTTELAAVKEYWFNYDGTSFCGDYPYGTVGQVYGGTNFFGTFFNGDPVYMYGIHWLPGSEFLSSFAIGESEHASLKKLYENYLHDDYLWTGKNDYAWQHITWPIKAMYDVDSVLENWSEEKVRSSSSTELFNVYYMVHAYKTLGWRTDEIWAEGGIGSTVYKSADGSNTYTALVFNPQNDEMTARFRSRDGALAEVKIPAKTLCAVDPVNGTLVRGYNQSDDFDLSDNVSDNENGNYEFNLIFAKEGKYNFIFSAENISGESKNITLKTGHTVLCTYSLGAGETLIDEKTEMSARLYGKYNITIEADEGVEVRNIAFERIKELKNVAKGAAVTTSDAPENDSSRLLNDGNYGSRYIADTSDNVAVILDLKQIMDVVGFNIFWEGANSKEYIIYVSADGENYTEAASFKNAGILEAREDNFILGEPLQARYIKLYSKYGGTQYKLSIYELEVLCLL